MLAIRLQRVGRTGYAVYRLAVQDSRRHPSSGRVVEYIGSYNPHTKEVKIETEVAQKYLDNGAQPTTRVAKLLKDAKVKLPKWVKLHQEQQSKTRNAEKLRKNKPSEQSEVANAEANTKDTIIEKSEPTTK